VQERYAVAKDQRTFQSRLEVFQIGRPISTVVQGGTLRIMDAARFNVIYSTDNWTTKTKIEARVVGRPGAFADIPVAADQTGSIIFTLYWPEENRWLGHNCQIDIQAEVPTQSNAADKPRA
jgi:glucoamylase